MKNKTIKDYYKLLVRLEYTINEDTSSTDTEAITSIVSILSKEMERCEKLIGLQHFNLSIDNIVEIAEVCASAAALCHNNCNIDPNKIDATEYGAEQIRDILCDYLKEVIEIE